MVQSSTFWMMRGIDLEDRTFSNSNLHLMNTLWKIDITRIGRSLQHTQMVRNLEMSWWFNHTSNTVYWRRDVSRWKWWSNDLDHFEVSKNGELLQRNKNTRHYVRLLLVCSVVRESELSLLLVSYVQNAHSLSLMHEKHPQAIISYAHLEMWCAYGIWNA